MQMALRKYPLSTGKRLSMCVLREGTFFVEAGGGGGGPGLRRGGSVANFFINWGGSNLFYSQPGEGHSSFGKEKITPCRFYYVYTSKATSQD